MSATRKQQAHTDPIILRRHNGTTDKNIDDRYGYGGQVVATRLLALVLAIIVVGSVGGSATNSNDDSQR
jgi:hypothetical protein